MNSQPRDNWPVSAIFMPLKSKIQDVDDDMESDTFYDGFKYLYSEDEIPEAGQSSRDDNNLRQEERNNSCPPLWPAPEID